MISKSKKADVEKVAKRANKQATKRGALSTSSELTEIERAGALDRLLQDFPQLRAVVHVEKSIDKAAGKVKLFFEFRPGYTSDDLSGEKLTAIEHGILIERDFRKGLLTWQEIAQECWEQDAPEEEPSPQSSSKGRGVKKKQPPPTADQVLSTSMPAGIRRFDPEAEQETVDRRKETERTVHATEIKLEAIEPNPWQPRSSWDDADLKLLAESLRREGQLQRILVREVAEGRYQLVDGERRLRAAKLAGWEGIAVDVGQISDQQMAELSLTANLERRDLNAIEEALAYQRLIQEFGYTQEQVAQKFRDASGGTLSASQVSNRLRLLRLPAAWQNKILSREIPPTHARCLVPVADLPEVIKEFESHLRRECKRRKIEMSQLSLAEFERMLSTTIEDRSETASQESVWSHKHSRNIPGLGLSAEQVIALDMREVTLVDYDGERQKENRFFNTKLYDKLWDAHEAAYVPKHAKAEQRREKSKAQKEKKLTAAEEKAKAAKLDRQFAQRVKAWRFLWLRYLIARAVTELLPDHYLFGSLLIYFATSRRTQHWRQDRDRDRSAAMTKARCPEANILWERLGPSTNAKIIKELICGWLSFDRKEGPQEMLPDEQLAPLANHLHVDRQAAWQHELAGPLTESFFNLHDKERLVALGRELDVYLEEHKPKSVLVKVLMGALATKQRLPAVLGASRKVSSRKLKGEKPRAKRKAGQP